MPGPKLFLLFLLYESYCKKFYNDPKNLGKQPRGCLIWYLGFMFKLVTICAVFMVAIFVFIALADLLSNL